MIKRILLFTLSVVLLFVMTLSIHSYFNTQDLSFQLWQVYLFHAVAALLVYIGVEGISYKLPNQAGYGYIMLVFFKLGAFVLIFRKPVFANEGLLQLERLALVVPLFIFLVAEAIAIAKLLNNK